MTWRLIGKYLPFAVLVNMIPVLLGIALMRVHVAGVLLLCVGLGIMSLQYRAQHERTCQRTDEYIEALQAVIASQNAQISALTTEQEERHHEQD